ncbi:MAG: Nucleotide sugar dehydrogenase [Candidatus Gottesmanbacteria bacterium GW2011_GWC2_39_8]|uniref:UDP-glucose 6-dehydrogenase n=1 Tax=Candidatus Gottesmanbacteria bacterium GW2011_GWC2_39_8 TaxID=1618450 RepID=A0A0G0T5Y2_9BACT|nr:MAG: Nucleotide sugar dehydrogenase [Candidatus Gottesmanbacteria bacterium GW2011_GWC2_39_8]
MNISVFGLGYVGCVTAACLADAGHKVIGVEIKRKKVDALNEGRSPFFEPGLSEVINRCAKQGTLRATTDVEEAVRLSDIALVCVGTPSSKEKGLQLDAVIQVCEGIGRALSKKEEYFVVAMRSTVLPGTSLEYCIPILEQFSGKRVGEDIGYCVNPEFLREGSAISDFHAPPFTIIGERDARSGDLLARLWSFVQAPLYRVPLGVSELVKYASNAFHALKIVFANEIGSLCRAYGIDSNEVMRIFVSDTKSNISSRYLRPGNAFGGSCLGKDLRALQFVAKKTDIDLHLLNAIIPSNNAHRERIANLVLGSNPKRVCFVGLSFKEGTDDLRESPAVQLVQRCLDEEVDVQIFDSDVLSSLYDDPHLKGTAQYMPDNVRSCIKSSMEEALDGVDLVVILKSISEKDYLQLKKWAQSGRRIIDLYGTLGRNAEELPCEINIMG